MSKFFIDSTSESADTTPAYVDSPSFGSDDEDTLPYPAELARNDFLAPDFDAQASSSIASYSIWSMAIMRSF